MAIRLLCLDESYFNLMLSNRW